jgi:DNA-directed RNA polymerase subunit K/omega
MADMDDMTEVPQPAEPADEVPPAFVPPVEPAPPITSRFLFVDVAALRAKQLRRGAEVRFRESESSPVPRKPERIAMEEVRRGLVYYDVPEQKGAREDEA